MSMEDHRTQTSISFKETCFIFLVSLVFFYFTSAYLGVWEIGESLQARLIEWMWTHETWMQVNLPLDDERVRNCVELAMGWWPSMLSVHWLAPKLGFLSPELALRLPSLILASLNITLLFSLISAWQKQRLLALVAIGFLLIMPSFNIASRHTLIAGGVGGLACSLSILCFFYERLKPSLGLRFLAWISLVLSACSLGILGLLLPLMAYFFVNKTARLWLVPALGLIALFYWRSWVKRPDQADLWHLFFTIDPLKESYTYADWSGFQNMLHLVGFNLFPFGALIPIIALSLQDLDRDSDSNQIKVAESSNYELTELQDLKTRHNSPQTIRIGQALLWLFVSAFFSSVLLAPSSGYWAGASLLMAIPVALASAHYFLDAQAQHKTPILYTVTILFLWWLIDGNVKREPGLIIAAISDESVKGLLPEFSPWRFGRLLSLLGLIFIIFTRTPLISKLGNLLKSKLTQQSLPRHHLGLFFASVLISMISIFPYLITILPRWTVSSAFMSAPFWGKVSLQVKVITFAILIATLAYHLLWLIWRSYAEKRVYRLLSRLDLEWGFCLSWAIIVPHYIGRLPMWRFMRPILPYLEDPNTHKPLYLSTLTCHIACILILSTGIIFFRKLNQKFIGDQQESFQSALIQKLSTLSIWQTRFFQSSSLRVSLALFVWLSASLVFSQSMYLQGLSSKFSHQDMIQGYEALMAKSKAQILSQPKVELDSKSTNTKAQDPLQLYKVKDAKKSFYLNSLNELNKAEFLKSTQASDRQFYIISRDRLSEVNHQFRRATQVHLPVLDDSHHELLLTSNKIQEGEKDHNPIKHAIISEMPKGATTLAEPINFENQIELVAWRLNPAQPRAGAPLKIELFWKAKRKIRRTWKVFVHIDAPGQRIHADHDPVAGVYPTQDWQVGDIIWDQHHITVKRSIKPATFTFFVGLYRGKNRMKIRNKSKKFKDHDNRAIIGKVRVR